MPFYAEFCMFDWFNQLTIVYQGLSSLNELFFVALFVAVELSGNK